MGTCGGGKEGSPNGCQGTLKIKLHALKVVLKTSSDQITFIISMSHGRLYS